MTKRQERIKFIVDAVIESSGNMRAAARKVGVHRNTIMRAMVRSGYTSKHLRELIRKADESAGPGRPGNLTRRYWKAVLKLGEHQTRELNISRIRQLQNCKDDVARRLITKGYRSGVK